MIGAKCFIANDTVKKHLPNIYKKIHLNSVIQAVAKALKYNIKRNILSPICGMSFYRERIYIYSKL